MIHPYILNIDPRDEKPCIKEVRDHLPKRKYAVRTQMYQDRYRWDCMNGQDHPLSIEQEEYILTEVHRAEIDSIIHEEQREWHRQYTFNQQEIEFIKGIMRQREVGWAIDNSFDGLYIHRDEDYRSFRSIYRFAVYMKTEQATFWKLKFHGT